VSKGHDRVTRLLSVLQVLVGVAVIGVTLSRGGGPLSLGVVLGIALVAVGVVRLYLQARIGRTE
jgi:multisubunit Na+/H+ antiporter MnhB subunit